MKSKIIVVLLFAWFFCHLDMRADSNIDAFFYDWSTPVTVYKDSVSSDGKNEIHEKEDDYHYVYIRRKYKSRYYIDIVNTVNESTITSGWVNRDCLAVYIWPCREELRSTSNPEKPEFILYNNPKCEKVIFRMYETDLEQRKSVILDYNTKISTYNIEVTLKLRCKLKNGSYVEGWTNDYCPYPESSCEGD